MLNSLESYVLGFAMGDGTLCCDSQGNPKRIRLYSTDREHLVEVARLLGGEVRLGMDAGRYPSKVGCKSTWSLYLSEEYTRVVVGFGFSKDKEYHKLPQNTEILPFLLGFLDADGTIHLRKTRGIGERARLLDSVFFLGTFSLLSGIFQWLGEEGFKGSFCKIPLRFRQTKQLYGVKLGAKHGFRLLSQMYQVSPLSLERKKVKYMEILSWYSRPIVGRTWCRVCGKKRSINGEGLCRFCVVPEAQRVVSLPSL